MVATISNTLNLSNIDSYRKGVLNPNFRGNSNNSLEKVPTQDTIEISKSKEEKGMSKVAKWALGIGGALATLTIGGFCIAKGQSKRLEKLYKEKLVLSNLPEKLDFKEAKTVEEGIKFAKEVLGIKNVDKNFSLEAINFVNKGLVDVSNANKGKVFLPTKLKFKEMEDHAIAGVYKYIEDDSFGRLTVNKKYFDRDFLMKFLKEHIPGLDDSSKISKEVAKETEKVLKEKGYDKQDLLGITWSDEFKNLVKKFKETPDKMSVIDLRNLKGLYNATDKMYYEQWHVYPSRWLEKNKNLFQKGGIEINLEEIKKLKIKDQTEKMFDILKQYHEKTGNIISLESAKFIPERTIYHEMGHLQDYAKNLKNLNLQEVKFWQKANRGISELDNRWRGTTYKGFGELFKNNPEKMKKLYPDMYEHLTNVEIQKTAGKVSNYAQTSIGEFVAEVYAGLISGTKYADDVMELYKKYNGPIPGIG